MSQPFGSDQVKAMKPEYSADKKWVSAGPATNIPVNKAVVIALEHFRIAVFHIGNEFFAIKDACPHAEYPLSKSVVCGEEVTCASHNWKFNLRTGCGVRGEPATDIRIFPTKIENDVVWVNIIC